MAEWMSVSTAVPKHRFTTAEVKTQWVSMHPASPVARFVAALDTSDNETRHTVLPLDQLLRLDGVEVRQHHFETEAVRLGEVVARDALQRARILPHEITNIIGVSSTGYLMPTLETRLIERLGLAPTCRRVPLVNLGCAGGAAALGLAAILANANPSAHVLVVSVELPSLSFPTAEPSPLDLIAAFQMGDGAAAAVIAGADVGCGPTVVASGGTVLPGTLAHNDVRLTTAGLRLMRSRGLAGLLRERLPDAVDRLLTSHQVSQSELTFWAIHPRNPELLNAAADSLAVPEAARAASRAVWRGTGNVVSAAVYHVLDELRASAPPVSGSLGMIVAFGAGFSIELVLLRAGGWLCRDRTRSLGEHDLAGGNSHAEAI